MDNQQEQKRVAFYIRVSTDDQADKYGPDLQRTALEKLIGSKGQLDDGRDRYVLAGEEYVYYDDISGTKNIDERPAFAKLMDDVQLAPKGHPPFDIVAVFKIDRLARRLKVLLNVVDFFEDYKIEFISANETIDTSTPFGRAVLGILGVIAELEIENIALRTKAGRAEAKKKGVVYGSQSYYGYNKNAEKQLVINEDEAKIIEDIFRWFTVDRKTYQQIADMLMARGILNPDASALAHDKRKGEYKGKYGPTFWRGEGVKSILENEVYIGLLHYNKYKGNKVQPKEKWQLSPHRHDAIIDEATFGLAQKYIQQGTKDSLETKQKRGDSLYLLSHLLKCQYCKSVVTPNHSYSTWVGDRKWVGNKAKTEGDYSYYYRCGRKSSKKFKGSTCPTIPIPAGSLDKLVIKFIQDLFRDPNYIFNFQKELASSKKHLIHLKEKAQRLQKVIERFEGRRMNIRKQHEMTGDDDIFKSQMKEVDKTEERASKDLAEVKAEINQLTLPTHHIQSFLEFTDKYKDQLDEVLKDKVATYELIHLLLEEVIVESRAVRPDDVIGGRKKEGQMMPFALHFKLRLPQKAVVELAKKKFGVNSDNL